MTMCTRGFYSLLSLRGLANISMVPPPTISGLTLPFYYDARAYSVLSDESPGYVLLCSLVVPCSFPS